ncbi:unnamed protein product [Brassica oleracea var. botrytis]
MEVVSSLGFRYLPSLPMTSSSNHRPHSPLKDRAPVKSPARPIRSKRTSTSPAKKHNLSGREMLFLSLPPLSRKCSFPHRWQEGFKPDVVTVAEVLPVCSELRDIKQGKEINCCYALKNLFLPNVSLVTSLMVMYSKCSVPEYPVRLFDKLVGAV